ncbi:MAG: hypothetical protein ACRDNJ_03905 [Solirubrobacteraceae bacterium]
MAKPSAVVHAVARHWTSRIALGVSLAIGGAGALPASALASHSQLAIIQDAQDLVDPAGTLQQFRLLGANTIRVVVPWATIAPDPSSRQRPSSFDATDPNDYPDSAWAPYDALVQTAAQDGITVDLTVTGGAPRWAESATPPKNNEGVQYLAWKPKAADYGQFVRAIGTRYSGHFTPAGASSPLPAVHFWAIFNEPNFGNDLGPQATHDSTVFTGPIMYRQLLDAGYSALRATGHRHDTIIWGEFAAQGQEPRRSPRRTGGLPGMFGQTRPLLFLRDLYCVDSSFRPMRGRAARASGCPTSGGGSRRFRRQHPALFGATAVSDHPYPQGESPVSRAGNRVDYAKFPDLGNLEATLDRATRAYGSHKRFPIYNTEYGYITNPPHVGGHHYPSPSKAAWYINWAEYLSWRQPRVASYMQYLLTDPPQSTGVYSLFSSGLEFQDGTHKPTYDAYRLPVYMPRTSFPRRTRVEVWGAARPAPFMSRDGDGPQRVSIQLNGRTVRTITVRSSTGYFDVHMRFPHGGTVRLAYTYPASDAFLPVSTAGQTVYSRSFRIRVH